MTYAELPVTGYLDRFSHRPGETFTAFVSLREASSYRAQLVRVVGGDPNPAGPGIQLKDFSARFDRRIDGHRQPIALGSCGIVDRGPVGGANTPRTWSILVCPTLASTEGTVIAEETATCRVSLSVSATGTTARLRWPGGALDVATGGRMLANQWYHVWVGADPASGSVVVGQQRIDSGGLSIARAVAPGLTLPNGGTVLFAAENAAAPKWHFTGKLEDPSILQGCVEAWPSSCPVLAAWDFSRDIPTQTIADTGPHACHGRLINVPTRAVVGTGWTGAEMCWRHAPRDYAAIHFHADDLGDCGWQPSFRWEVPDDMPSGAYALHLTCEGGEDFLPLYILPKRNGPFAPIAFLASTFTYQAYANHARGNADAAYLDRVAAWGAYPYNPDQYPVYGRSMYNVHLDGSGVAFSSRLRPVLTMRPGFLTFDDKLGSGLRHYPADTHLLAWLDAKDIPFDIVTDEDLDENGVDLLRPYKALLTGSHPEYHTSRTLDALAAYTKDGGRMAYLGGNGFYWRVARDPAMPGIIELRRAEGGIRTWAAEPGEYYHQFDGAYGGLWRRNRRPPQMLAGVGFSGQGLFEGTHYRLLPAARDPRYAWMFDGIAADTIGDYGLSGGGAAGFELDRADTALGTPDGTVILARSEDPPASFFTVPEEVLAGRRTVSGERLEALMRAEIVYFETEGGGAVFSVGSITFCGSLWRNGFEGPISQLLENVVRRFGAA
ncbi:MAG: N,N-dimethylformamidase beta subunit family domain-containing protein [Rhodospirillales bacterium]